KPVLRRSQSRLQGPLQAGTGRGEGTRAEGYSDCRGHRKTTLLSRDGQFQTPRAAPDKGRLVNNLYGHLNSCYPEYKSHRKVGKFSTWRSSFITLSTDHFTSSRPLSRRTP